MTTTKVDTLDMSRFRHGSDLEREAFALRLAECFAQQGFVKLINHCIPHDVVHEAFEWVRTYLSTPIWIAKMIDLGREVFQTVRGSESSLRPPSMREPQSWLEFPRTRKELRNHGFRKGRIKRHQLLGRKGSNSSAATLLISAFNPR
jgi:hypothetical protein